MRQRPRRPPRHREKHRRVGTRLAIPRRLGHRPRRARHSERPRRPRQIRRCRRLEASVCRSRMRRDLARARPHWPDLHPRSALPTRRPRTSRSMVRPLPRPPRDRANERTRQRRRQPRLPRGCRARRVPIALPAPRTRPGDVTREGTHALNLNRSREAAPGNPRRERPAHAFVSRATRGSRGDRHPGWSDLGIVSG